MKKVLLAIILIAAIGYAFKGTGTVVQNPSTADTKATKETIREARTSNLSKIVLVGTSRNGYDHAMKLHRNGENTKLDDLISEGRAFVVDGDTLVRIINSDKIYSEIEVMEGVNKGKKGTIYNSMIFEKK
jgi:hypothetical protein